MATYALPIGGGTLTGNLSFSAANPSITASSYTIISGGAYFNSGTVYTEARIQARGGIGNDSGSALTISGGTSGSTNFSGDVNLTAVPFFNNAQTVAANYTVPSGYNSHSAGPITINTGVTVTVSTGSTWVIL